VHEQDLAISLRDSGEARIAPAPRGLRAVLRPAAVGAIVGALVAVAVLVALSRLGQVQLGAPAGSLEARLAAAEGELGTLRETASQQQQTLFRLSLAERRATDTAPASGEDAVRDAIPVLLALQIVRDRLADGGPFATAVAALRPFARAGRDREGAIDALIAHAARGVATVQELRAEFARVAPLLEAQARQREGIVLGPIWRGVNGLLSSVGIVDAMETDPLRRVGPEVDIALARGDVASAVAAVERLDGGEAAVGPWLAAARARLAVEHSVEALRAAAWRIIVERP
jgi:hypothetical protein